MPATVTVQIVGRSYEVGCDDGQEERVKKLAADIDKRANELLKSVGAVGEARLLFMVAILLADELSDAKSTLERERAAFGPADAAIAGGLESLAKKVDAIAAGLESA